MAKVKRNPILEGLSGSLRDVVFRHTKNGKTIICKKPDFSNRQFSQDQIDHQDRMKLAAAYGVANKKNPLYVKKLPVPTKTPITSLSRTGSPCRCCMASAAWKAACRSM